jgi:hypothetical protein
MPKPDENAQVQVVVHTSPNKVWVFCEDRIHSARWRTSETGDNLREVNGNAGLIHAAMLAWEGQEAFTGTFGWLEERSQGYGAWAEEPSEAVK